MYTVSCQKDPCANVAANPAAARSNEPERKETRPSNKRTEKKKANYIVAKANAPNAWLWTNCNRLSANHYDYWMRASQGAFIEQRRADSYYFYPIFPSFSPPRSYREGKHIELSARRMQLLSHVAQHNAHENDRRRLRQVVEPKPRIRSEDSKERKLERAHCWGTPCCEISQIHLKWESHIPKYSSISF